MKNIIFILTILSIALFCSCSTQSKLSSYNDDVYANPTEDRKEEARLAAIEKQKKLDATNRYNDSIAQIKQKQKAIDDANPNYKEREFKYDDYYDYEYATRIKRFDNNINGLSYYDNYYTNSYWYNQNPYNYGVSVYNGYSWWGNGYNLYSYNPSTNFYYNNGWYSSFPSGGYMGYNPYNTWGNSYWQGYNNGYHNGYNNGYNNGWNGYPYYGYGNYGYNNYNPYGNYYGYGNNNYNGSSWGYYNSYDNNSGYTYGPRTSHGGSNSQRSSSAGMTTSGVDNNYYNTMVKSVSTLQNNTNKFDNTVVTKNVTRDNETRGNIRNQSNDLSSPNKSFNPDNKTSTYPNRDSYNGGSIKNDKNPDVYTTPGKSQTTPKDNEVYYNNSEPKKQNPSNNNNSIQPKSNRNNIEITQPKEQPKYYEVPAQKENFQRGGGINNGNNSNGGGNNSTPSNNGGGSQNGGGRPR